MFTFKRPGPEDREENGSIEFTDFGMDAMTLGTITAGEKYSVFYIEESVDLRRLVKPGHCAYGDRQHSEHSQG